MKHIITLVMLLSFLHSTAQYVTGHVYWPKGGIVEMPLTLHVEYDGCPQLNRDIEFDNGSISFIEINPLLDCDSIRFSLSGEAQPRDRVSTLDMVRIQKHLFALAPFTNALQIIAADANNSASVSALDLVEIRRMIIGQYTEWPHRETLLFFHKTTALPPPITTWPVSEVAIPYGVGIWSIDFWMVKTGDVN